MLVPPRGDQDVCPCGVPCTPPAQSVRWVQNSGRLAYDFNENYLLKKGPSCENEMFMYTLASAHCKVNARKFPKLCHELMPVKHLKKHKVVPIHCQEK